MTVEAEEAFIEFDLDGTKAEGVGLALHPISDVAELAQFAGAARGAGPVAVVK